MGALAFSVIAAVVALLVGGFGGLEYACAQADPHDDGSCYDWVDKGAAEMGREPSADRCHRACAPGAYWWTWGRGKWCGWLPNDTEA